MATASTSTTVPRQSKATATTEWTPEEDARLLAEFPFPASCVDYSGSFARVKKAIGSTHNVAEIKQRLKYLKSLEPEPGDVDDGDYNEQSKLPQTPRKGLSGNSAVQIHAPMTPSFEAAVRARRVTGTNMAHFAEDGSTTTSTRSSVRARRPPAALLDSVVELTPARREAVKAKRVTGASTDALKKNIAKTLFLGDRAKVGPGVAGTNSAAAAADGPETPLLPANAVSSPVSKQTNQSIFDPSSLYKPRTSSNLRFETGRSQEVTATSSPHSADEEEEHEAQKTVLQQRKSSKSPKIVVGHELKEENSHTEKDNTLFSPETRGSPAKRVNDKSNAFIFTDSASTPPPARAVTGKRRRTGGGGSGDESDALNTIGKEQNRKKIRLSEEISVIDAAGNVAFKSALGSKEWKRLDLGDRGTRRVGVRGKSRGRGGRPVGQIRSSASRNLDRGTEEHVGIHLPHAADVQEKIPVGQTGWLFSILRTIQQRLGFGH